MSLASSARKETLGSAEEFADILRGFREVSNTTSRYNIADVLLAAEALADRLMTEGTERGGTDAEDGCGHARGA